MVVGFYLTHAEIYLSYASGRAIVNLLIRPFLDLFVGGSGYETRLCPPQLIFRRFEWGWGGGGGGGGIQGSLGMLATFFSII